MKPGEPVQVTLTLYPTSNLFMPGHRIRLDVSSSNFPRFDVNPNTGEAIGRERRRVVADNTVSHERGRESRVVLPIVPVENSEGDLLLARTSLGAGSTSGSVTYCRHSP